MCAGQRPAHTWFLEMLFSGKLVCVHMCLLPRLLITIHMKVKPLLLFKFLYVTLAIVTVDGNGLSNEARHKLLLSISGQLSNTF